MTLPETFECPCCRKRTLSERGHYEICEVCNWEDDPIQEDDPAYEGGANADCLNVAREKFARHGTSKP
ncbi:MAG: hypothetical protein HOV80_09015 [Polyangiaceae bacterium]|nr:hypothetical protein [Polyangiaceae bacterium]